MVLRLSLFALFASAVTLSPAQVLDVLFVPENPGVPDRVLSKTIWEFKPKHQQASEQRITYYERFDDQGRLVEEKDFNLNGSLYSWSFIGYDEHDNQDTVIMQDIEGKEVYRIFASYDNQNRQVHRKGVNVDGSIRFESFHQYGKKKETYTGWFHDPAKASHYVDYMNANGLIEREVRYAGKDQNGEKYYEAFYTYRDTILTEKVEHYIENGEVDRGAIYRFDPDTRTESKVRLKAGGVEVPVYEKVLNEQGDEISRKIYRRGEVMSYDFIDWKYKDGEVIEKKTYSASPSDTGRYLLQEEYFMTYTDWSNHLNKWHKKVDHEGLGPEFRVETLVVKRYNQDGLWLSTTVTRNGELEEYRYATYEFVPAVEAGK